MRSAFFDKLVYSSANEDGQIELATLNLSASSRVLCITGSGSRPLDLLIAQPAHIVAIDLNPRQNFLLELKMAAFRRLAHPELLAFLGVTASRDRLTTYAGLRQLISLPARDFWDQERRAIEAGVLTAGRWHRYLTVMAALMVFRRSLLTKLFTADDVASQRLLWQTRWDGYLWRAGLNLLGSRWLWKTVIREPGAALISPQVDISAYLAGRFQHFTANHLLRDSFFAHLLFFGRLNPACLPLYLQEHHFDTIRQGLDRISMVTDSLSHYLQTVHAPATVDAYSLSDVASYASPLAYDSIWQGLLRTAAPDARMCERQFLVKRAVPGTVSDRFSTDQKAVDWATETDISFIYTFRIGTLHGRS